MIEDYIISNEKSQSWLISPEAGERICPYILVPIPQ